VQDAETISKAVRLFETSKADFADCLIEGIGGTHDCEYIATFDKGAAAAGMRLIS
jgi:predicted nucleic-acid-binding protein